MRIIVSATVLALTAACTSSVAQESRATSRDDAGEVASAGALASREYDASAFERVSLATPDTVEIVHGQAFSVRAQGDQSILDALVLSVEGGTLRIRYRAHENGGDWDRPDVPPVRIAITMPRLNGVSVAGAGDIAVGRFAAQRFEAAIAGSGDIAIESLQTDEAAFSIAGSGDLDVAGTAGSIDLSIAGSGDVTADDFRAQTMNVDIAGSGSASAYVTDAVQASFVGSGDVMVRGGAQCRSSTIGAGRLRCN